MLLLQANSLHWPCLKLLPDVHDTPLWKCMCNTLNIIAECTRVSSVICGCMCLGSMETLNIMCDYVATFIHSSFLRTGKMLVK